MSRTTSSVRFYCRACKADRHGLAPIEVSITINQKRKFINLTRKERPEQFAKETAKKTSELSDYLEQIRQKINQIQTELIRLNQPVTADNIREYIKNGGTRTYTIEDCFREYYSIHPMSSVTYDKYKIIEKSFIQHLHSNMEMTQVSPQHISSFYQHLRQTEKTSTSGCKMQKLKTIFRFAWESGRIPQFPFNCIKINKGKPAKEYLTPTEIRAIKGKRITIERLSRVRDLFIFQMSTGLSYADIADVKEIHQRNGTHYIKGTRRKTGIEFTAVVLPDGLEIWNRYNGILPLLTNQKYNSYLKEIGDICGTQTLKTHLARKTYATILLNAGVSLHNVAKSLGHSPQICHKHYASVMDESLIDEVSVKI